MAERPLLLYLKTLHQHTQSRRPLMGAMQAAAKPVSCLDSQLPIFFQILLQRYQGVVNPSKVLSVSSHEVVHH